MSRRSIVGIVGTLGALSANTLADTRPAAPPPGIDAIRAGAPTSPADGTVGGLPYRTSFESAQGYAPGAIAGQSGWTTFDATPQQPTVANVNPQQGAQHLRLVDTPAVPDTTLSGAFSPPLGLTGGQRSATSVWLSINNVTPGPNGGADYTVVGQEVGALDARISYRVKFQFTGDVVVADDVDNDGNLEFNDTGFDWQPNTYNNLRVFHNPASNQIAYFLNESLIYQSVRGIFGGDDVSQVVLFSDNFFQPGESGDFDNLSVFDPIAGDANVNGVVNLDDFNVLAANFGTASGATWIRADFDGNGNVNLDDFNLLAANFGLSAAGPEVTPGDWAALGAAVPEPTTLPALGLAVSALVTRRRRSRGA